MSALGNLRGKLILGLVLGLVVVAGLSVYADFSKMLNVLREFNWWLLVPIVAFTLFNYGLRFFKWDTYLHVVGVHGVSKKDSLLIFLTGFAMAMTPGKVGEVLKSYLLKQIRGTPISVSAPIVMAERVTDGLAMLVLGLTGLVLFDYGRIIMIVIAVAAVVFLFVVQNRAVADRLLNRAEKLPVISKTAHHLRVFYDSSYALFRLPNLLFGVGIGVISWFGEVLAFVLVMIGLGVPFSWMLVILCSFILAAATLIGSVTLLPGGLGTAEASITGMLIVLFPQQLGVPMPQDIAVAATLLIRFATLWFGVGIGVIALTMIQRRLGNVDLATVEEERQVAYAE